MDADGAECPRRVGCSIVQCNLGLREHNMANDAVILFHHKVQLWDEIGICSILIEHVMLCASRTVDVPECLTCKVLNLTIIFFCSNLIFIF